MTTTQSKDPNEKVNHPRHYNQHPSNIETIEIIEHLPGNLCNCVKYVWRYGLKQSENPLRDLKSAYWYAKKEVERIELYELYDEPKPKTEVVWRALAHKVVGFSSDGHGKLDLLGKCLQCILEGGIYRLPSIINETIFQIENLPPRNDGKGIQLCYQCNLPLEDEVHSSDRPGWPNAPGTCSFKTNPSTPKRVSDEALERLKNL